MRQSCGKAPRPTLGTPEATKLLLPGPNGRSGRWTGFGCFSPRLRSCLFLMKIRMKAWKVLCFRLKWQVFSQLLRPGGPQTQGSRSGGLCRHHAGVVPPSFCFRPCQALCSFAAKGRALELFLVAYQD